MTVTQDFFISIIEIIPLESDILLSSDCESLLLSVKNMKGFNIEGNYTAKFKLTKENKDVLINEVVINNSEEYMHYFQVSLKKEILFIAYDGFQMGTVSSRLDMPIGYLKEFERLGLCLIIEKISDEKGYKIS